MAKLILVSNRLPVSLRLSAEGFELQPSTGGLATGLSSVYQQPETIWVGWHGCQGSLDPTLRQELQVALEERRLFAVDIPEEDLAAYYDEVSNGAFWPLYHYQLDKMPLVLKGWEAYRRTNERFAEAIAAHYEPGDTIWVHDYHLQLLPALLRERLPQARIGFFLHIPFPSSEIFRILPWRAAVLEGLLGSDVIGFHTHAYARHFRSSLLRILGIDAYADEVSYAGRRIKIGAFPLGVDVSQIDVTRSDVSSDLEAALIRMKSASERCHILLAIDRLDYTKGLPRRLLAVEELLDTRPELRGKVVLVQIAAPSRDQVPAYETYRREVEGLVGRINGRFGMPAYQPIHYIHRSLSPEEVLGLYRHVDVMVVTPLRDGMNLVAKEFIAARSDLDGVLVLSEFAGAAVELGEALQVNPYNITDTAEGLFTAIEMPEEERRARMKALRERVVQFEASSWALKFLEFFQDPTDEQAALTYQRPEQLAEKLGQSEKVALFIDYDGTLFPIVRIPQLAAPDKPLLRLLKQLAKDPLIELHIVTGRSHLVLDKWFADTPVYLHAEHGAMSRAPESGEWISSASPQKDESWKAFVIAVLQDFTRSTPGSFIEEKKHSITWHYRLADLVHGERVANELRLHGRETFAPMGLDLLAGKRIIEIRQMGINKGRVIMNAIAALTPGTSIVAIGDDLSDEDMFSAVPPEGFTVVVGDAPSKAQYRVRGPVEVRRLLETLSRVTEDSAS